MIRIQTAVTYQWLISVNKKRIPAYGKVVFCCCCYSGINLSVDADRWFIMLKHPLNNGSFDIKWGRLWEMLFSQHQCVALVLDCMPIKNREKRVTTFQKVFRCNLCDQMGSWCCWCAKSVATLRVRVGRQCHNNPVHKTMQVSHAEFIHCCHHGLNPIFPTLNSSPTPTSTAAAASKDM